LSESKFPDCTLISALYAEAELPNSTRIASAKFAIVDCDQRRASQQPIFGEWNSLADDDEIGPIRFRVIGILHDLLQYCRFIAIRSRMLSAIRLIVSSGS
jgi:hypothetical protein